jgi:hypothetical protein
MADGASTASSLDLLLRRGAPEGLKDQKVSEIQQFPTTSTHSFLKKLDEGSLEELDTLQNVRPLGDDVRRRQNDSHDLLRSLVALQQIHEPVNHPQ